MTPFKSTVMHVLELVFVLAAVVGIALFVKSFFSIDETPVVEVATGLVLAGLMKYLRANPTSPVDDYVNNGE